MAPDNRDHDLMMIAWVFALYRKYISCRAALRIAADQEAEKEDMRAHVLRGLLEQGDVRCLAVEGKVHDVGYLAGAYASHGCCALVRIEGLPESPKLAWHLTLGRKGVYFATVDFQPDGQRNPYPGNSETYMTGEAVFCTAPLPRWCGDWDHHLKEVDSL